MTTNETKHGTYTHGVPYRSGQTWFRRDHFTPRDGSRSGKDRLFAEGPADDSPLCRHWESGVYDGDACSCCYLGFSHTQDRHEGNLRRHTEGAISNARK